MAGGMRCRGGDAAGRGRHGPGPSSCSAAPFTAVQATLGPAAGRGAPAGPGVQPDEGSSPPCRTCS